MSLIFSRWLRRLLCLACLACTNPAAWAQDGPGLQRLYLPAPARERPLEVLLWYPAEPGGKALLLGENQLFKGSPVRQDAPAAPGRYPLLLLSHGSGGNAANMGWLAGPLAQQGFIVAAPNHPGTTTGDSTPEATMRIWERPADISAVLSALLAHPDWQARIQPDRVAVLGFSLGGHTALALAGARVNLDSYARYCKDPAAMTVRLGECRWLAGSPVGLRQLDATRFGQSFKDPRIQQAIAIDPGLAQAFEVDSLRSITVPVQIINLGRPGTHPRAVAAAPLAQAIPGSGYATVPDAIHFSFLLECQANGRAVLATEGDSDPLCDDGGSRPRADIHAELLRLVSKTLVRP
ncbi:alpha/beta hydrolase family protein [Rhodoferax sp.]|uniref:alpha/beta hydrolase family protein n=1 Tax=Rhodoferax sp. TaxID=50421 RepID=UPI00374D635E